MEMTPAEMDALYARVMELDSKRTPGKWIRRRAPGGRPDNGGIVQCEVAGKPYAQEIAADDYFDELSREADLDFIAAAPDMIRLIRAQHEATEAMRARVEMLTNDAHMHRCIREQDRARVDRLVQVLAGIHSATAGPPFKLDDGRWMQFNPPDAQAYLRQLSAAITRIPEAIDAARKEPT